MGETITEMALDDNASYVLTEDMIDAAMNEQFSYQDDIESEECSQGDSMVTVINPDQSSLESTDSRLTEAASTEDSAEKNKTKGKPTECDTPSTSVLVIETGLNTKVGDSNNSLEGKTSLDSNEDIIKVVSSSQDSSTAAVTSNESWRAYAVNEREGLSSNQSTSTKKSETDQAPILANMLKETPVTSSIDVCEEETSSEISEDELMEQESVDDELQSVMESNLMAEVGITVTKNHKEGDKSIKDPFQAPKISVKSISQISTSDFENMPEASLIVDSVELQNNRSESASKPNSMIKVSKERNEGKPMSLHLNKIAVPNNETFVNKQGEMMRCVYLKAPSENPIVPFNKPSPPVLSPPVDNTQLTNKKVTFPSAGMYTPPQRKPIFAPASNLNPNNRMTQPNMYQSHKLIPIVPCQTTTAKSNFKLISTIQKANFEGPKVYAAAHNFQNWQKPPANSTDNQKEIYLPDVLLAPEHLNKKLVLPKKDSIKIGNFHKPKAKNVYESTPQRASNMNGSLINDAGQSGQFHRLAPFQKQSLISNSYSSPVPILQKSPLVSSNRPNSTAAHDISTQTVYQYDNSGMDSIIKTLLFHNLKKPYVPPENHPCMEKLTYNCPDCSDRFIFEKNLAEHLARKTVLIRYMCKLCGSEIHFYNRCLLFKHLRMHNNSIKDLDTSCIQISDLPKDLIDKGIVSSCFKHNVNQVNLQKHERVLKNSKFGQWQATEVDMNRPYRSSVYIDKITNLKINIPTVSKFAPYTKKNTSASFSPVVTSSETLTPVATSAPSTSLIPLQQLVEGVSTPSFTPVVASSSMITPVTHPTYSYAAPTTTDTSSVITSATTSAYSPFIQKLSNQLANQLKCATARPNNSLLINKPQTQNLKSAQSSKIIFLSKVPPPRPNLIRPVQNKELKSILKAPVRDNKVEQLNNILTPPSQHISVDRRVQQANKSNENVKDTSQDDMIIDIDVDQVLDNLEEEIVDVESVWIDNGNDSTRSNSINGQKTSRSVGIKTCKRNCSECGVSCLNISKHLNGNSRPSFHPAMECQTCHLVLPTRCALRIHNRIHSQTQPYKCPDCGKDFTVWSDFYSHLKYSCGHLAKCIRFLCLSCKEHFPSREILGDHLKSKHSRDVYKCQFCPVAFYSMDALQKHTPEKHPDEECILQTHHKQCSICTKKVVPLEKFNAHMDQHIKSSNSMVYGYKCPMCTLTYSNKMAFVIHQIKEKAKGVFGPERKTALTKSLTKHQVIDVEEVNSEVLTKHQVTDVEEVNAEAYDSINSVETDEPTIETYCDSDEVVEKDPLSLDDCEVKKIKKEAEELCIICKKTNIAPNSKSSCCKNCVSHLSAPISVDESPKSLGFRPKQNQEKPCPKSKKRSLSTDESSNESRKPKNINSMSRNVSVSSDNEVGSFPSSANILAIKKKNRRKPNKSHQAAKGLVEGQIISSSKPTKLTCSKCNNFSGSTKEEFLVHIKSHRTEPNSYQCMECGLCFVVLPSLERHLQMYHQVKDVTSYVNKNNACMPQKTIYFEEKSKLKENQCPVCGDVFETQLIFEKHFRGHGRAFMSTLKK